MATDIQRTDPTRVTRYTPTLQNTSATTTASGTTTTQPADAPAASASGAGTFKSLRGSLDARARFAADSGASQRAYALQTRFARFDSGGDSGGESGPTTNPVEPPESRDPTGLPTRIDLDGVVSGRVTPTGQELVDHINALRKLEGRTGDEALIPSEDAAAFNNLSPQERRFYAATLYEQDKIVIDKDPVARRDYQYNVMQHAADIAGDDNQKFIDLTHAAFSAPANAYGSTEKYKREAVGSGASQTGQYLESAYTRVDSPNEDYNPLVRDVDNSSSITHHYGEFLQAHGVLWKDPYDLVTEQDSADENPGDVRNGFFAVMIGDGLRDKKITPQQAVDLTRWAFSADPGGSKGPPWGTTATDANNDNKNFGNAGWGPWSHRDYNGYLDKDHYKGKIDDWVKAYNEAHA